MCTEYKDITSKARRVLHKRKNQESAQNDNEINPTQWYRFVDHVTKEPMKVCSFSFKLLLIATIGLSGKCKNRASNLK